METVLRVAIVYAALLAGLRVLGKRELSQMSAFELVTLMLLPEMLSPSLSREDVSLVNGLTGAATLLCLVFLNSLLSYRFQMFRSLTESEPAVLIRHGEILQKNLARERIPAEEVFSEMHKSGIEHLADVRWGILEPDGRIGFVPFGRPEPQRPADSQEGLPGG